MGKRCFIFWVTICLLGTFRFCSPFFLHADDRLSDQYSSNLPPHTSNELIIEFKPGIKIAIPKNKNSIPITGIFRLDSLNAVYQAKALIPLIAPLKPDEVKPEFSAHANTFVLKFSNSADVSTFIDHYKTLPFFETVEFNSIYTSHASKIKNLATIEPSQFAELASLVEPKNHVIIGIIDTGIDWQKKHLQSHLWKNPRELLDGIDNDNNGFVDDLWGWNFADPELMQAAGLQWKNKPDDTCGHGTIIAEICNQISNCQPDQNTAHMNRLMIVKAGFSNAEGSIVFTTASTSRSIIYAANQGAEIINIAWGSAFPSAILKKSIDYAVKKGCFIIASAGNENSRQLTYPAALANVCAVAAIDSANRKSSTSNYGHWINLTANGTIQLSDTLATKISGTSIAAAYATGMAGLTARCSQKFNADSLKRTLIWSSDNIYKIIPEYFGQLGAGKINVKRALLADFQSNIIIQNCISLKQNQAFAPGDEIPVAIHVKNFSFPAKNVQIKLRTDNPAIEMRTSELAIPVLDYGHQIGNESAPFDLLIKEALTNENQIRFHAFITADNGFSSSQELTLAVGKSPPKNLTIINNSPVALYWSDEEKFSGYHLYRRNEDQPSFVRISQDPLLLANFIDNDVDAGYQYFYYITGVDQFNNETPASNIVSLKVAAGSQFSSSSKNQNTEKIRIHAVFPPSDTALSRGDRLQFRCILDANNSGTVKYSWILNEKLQAQGDDSVYVLVADSLQAPNNSLKVVILNADTVISFYWKIKLVQRQMDFMFYPASDTTIMEGDTLAIGFEAGENTKPTRAIKWVINGIHDNTVVKNYYILAPNFKSSGIDSITLNYQSADTSFSHRWLITILDREPNRRILTFHPSQDTTIAREDTLDLLVNVPGVNQDSLAFQWSLNGKIDTTAIYPFYTISQKNPSTTCDTILVAITDQDSTYEHGWLIHYLKKRNQAPRIISCIPPLDSTMSKPDSIRLQVSCFDPDGDSLTFAWYKNSEVDTAANDSTYLYRNHLSSGTNDTLGITISDADTTIELEWILWAATTGRSDSLGTASLSWFPEQDSIFAVEDSLAFSIHYAGDSSRFQWSINSVVDSSSSDSIYIFHPSNPSSLIDTIAILIFAQDTIISHSWQVFYSNFSRTTPGLSVEFSPKNETIDYAPNDSLKFSVQVLEGNFEEMKFSWHINQEPDTTFQDTTFRYMPNLVINTPDTVHLNIFYHDSTFSNKWIIIKNKYNTLPPPVLVFPIKGDIITDEDLLTWQNDSSLARIDSLRSCRFLIQIAKDTTFKQIVSVDTCKMPNIALKKLSGFNQISMGKPFYWRVKLFATYFSMSEYKKCAAPFYFYPLFSKLENFYGQENEEGHIDLIWITSYEKNCAGFNLYRSESQDADFIKLNDELITGSTNFSFEDRTAESGATYFYKLEDVCVNNRKKFHQTITVTAPKPEKYFLYQNYPNPFNSTTSFKYEIPIATLVKIEVYNVLGRKVKTLVNENKEAGYYTVDWDGIDDQNRNVVSGLYFYHMSTGKFNMTHKMIVVR